MKLLFTKEQLQRLANIFDNAGQIFFGTSVLTPIIFGVEKDNKLVVILGLVGMLFCWWVSLRIERLISKI
ncbi:hypothetical protein HYW87_02920 [Candidatus Roizmanbacteria bacterium]|nr:hypothetical protein [Candidatus Roizmanbacteria bacterium]